MFPDGKNLRALIFFHNDSISPYLLRWKFSNKNQKTKERRFVKRFFILSYRRIYLHLYSDNNTIILVVIVIIFFLFIPSIWYKKI